MADGDCAAIDVDDRRIPAEILVDRAGLGGEGFVGFDQIEIADCFQPAFSSALRDAGIGPVPMILGSTPAVAQDTMRASGLMPRRDSFFFRIISRAAAAPSLRPDALPAVTVPSLSKAGAA
jgi:hypothetical protein